ncbi:adenosine deaminase [Candidatus Frackibacter sp. WG12]|uniref:adenosine deaminase n=1 Tax=Candidatus Frackibacter sp. WG12 TaxID=2017977 RepID=UPI0008BB9B2E|nr:adenosine deaminase [Candidatus Frackibacter sp. WG12]SEM84588.1 adenosine deaminase [Candidatus Frackibacter sp. WG12]
MKDLIRELPKVELHLHLDGSLRVETVVDLAKELEVELPTNNKEELKSYLQVDDECESLVEYLKKFEFPLKVMQTKNALQRVAYELAEDAAQDNIKYLEVRFAPLMLASKLSKEEVVEAVLSGLKKAERDYDLQTNIILCCMRHQDPSKSVEVVQLASDYLGKGVVGVDLAGDEADFPPEEHEKAFQLAKGIGLHRTVHAGEAAGADSVRKAIDYLNAERIGHGIRAKEDTETLEIIQESKIALEVCPTSNVHTKVVYNLSNHPVKEYFDLGVLVTINTDNRTVSNLTLSEEYIALYENFDFEIEDIKQLILNGVEAAFINKDEREELINKFKAEFTELEAEYQ